MARREKKIALNVGDNTYNQLSALADVQNTNVGRLCREILEAYLVAHATEIADAQIAAKVYRESIAKLRPQFIETSLFGDDTLKTVQGSKDDI